jgi:hypothetical protein
MDKCIRWVTLPLLLLMAGAAVAATEPVGKAITVIGKVNVARDVAEAIRLKRMDPVYRNDLITTAERAQAKLLLNDNSILKLAPASEMRLSDVMVDGADEEKTVIDLLKGRVRSLVGKRLGAASRYEVHTKVAVAGVRGTDFVVWITPEGNTVVRCFEGSVEVRNADPAVGGSVILGPNTFSVVGVGVAPTPPAQIAPDEPLPGAEGSDSGSAGENEIELLQIEIADFELFSETFPDLEFGADDRLFFSSEVLDDGLFGTIPEQQLEVYPYPGALPGLGVSVDITIPLP